MAHLVHPRVRLLPSDRVTKKRKRIPFPVHDMVQANSPSQRVVVAHPDRNPLSQEDLEGTHRPTLTKRKSRPWKWQALAMAPPTSSRAAAAVAVLPSRHHRSEPAQLLHPETRTRKRAVVASAAAATRTAPVARREVTRNNTDHPRIVYPVGPNNPIAACRILSVWPVEPPPSKRRRFFRIPANRTMTRFIMTAHTLDTNV